MSDDKPTSSAPKADPAAETRPPEPGARAHTGDPRLIPGGAHGSSIEIGMSALNPDDVPVADETP
ncbi:MAG TPA: hypothetical protein VHI99_30880 [Vicinamibacterales bacterium]|jgi:hypothetical protein|nr:hypothetical protein [Vicinamibacterales bacterium]